MLGLPLALAGVVVTAALAAASVYAGALTSWAGVVAAAFGVAIVVLGGFAYLALLVLFVVASVLATRYALDEKKRRNVQEGTEGERGVSNVLAHIVVPTALVGALLVPAIAPSSVVLTTVYASALSFGAADTFASEFGVLQGRAVSILTLRPVTAGTNGGVSLLGTVWAAVGAMTTAVVGYGLFALFDVSVGPVLRWIPLVAVAGFAGCQIDSVLGETLENRGYLTKGGTNFLSMLGAVGVASLALFAVGAL
ncbi:MAG: DUF92 domain-containing protein [Thermoplasmata archaeon]|nr:DUF92 domain-containing protein [Thermoplasmata archaeon]